MRTGSGVFDRARTAFWEQSEKFSDLIAENSAEERVGPRPRRTTPTAN